MTVTQNLSKKSPSIITQSSLKKLIKSYKTLIQPEPKPRTDIRFGTKLESYLTLDHPVIKKLDSCSNLTQFNQVQAQLITLGIFQNPFSAGRVIKKLASLPRLLNHAVSVLGSIENPDAFMCNVIVRRFWEEGELENCLRFYYLYFVFRGVWHNRYTFPLVIRVCSDFGSVLEGEKVHCWVLKCGFGFHLIVRNSLIRMYSVLGGVSSAENMFDESPELDIVSWNTMIDGYVKNGEVGLARELFNEMKEKDEVTWNSMIAGYVGAKDMESAIELFGTMPNRDVISWNCLLDGCAKIGDILAARKCFNRIPRHNVVSWNIMLSLYVRCKEYEECLRLFDSMIEKGNIQPNEASLVSVLTACGHLGKLDKGKCVHSYINLKKGMKPEVFLSTALLTMYTKCGDMDSARRVFDMMPEKSVVSWNSMITGYGLNGLIDNALNTFLEMGKSGQVPNNATFVCVLAVCAHSERVLEGWWYFHVMHRVYNMDPKVEHYGCMVDLLTRAKLVKDTKNVSWSAVLSACKARSNLELGKVVAKWLIQKDPEDMAPYLLLSNIYAEEGRWEIVDYVRRRMERKGLHRNAPAYSLKDSSFHRNSMIASMLIRMGSQLKISGF